MQRGGRPPQAPGARSMAAPGKDVAGLGARDCVVALVGRRRPPHGQASDLRGDYGARIRHELIGDQFTALVPADLHDLGASVAQLAGRRARRLPSRLAAGQTPSSERVCSC